MTTPRTERGRDELLARARELIGAAIRRRWDEGLLARDPDGVFTSLLGADHVEKLLAGRPAAAQPVHVEEREYAPGSPLATLVERARLGPSQGDLLAVLLACEVDPAVARLMAYLGGNQASLTLTVDLIFEAVYRVRTTSTTDAAAMLHDDIAAGGVLRRLRLIVVDGQDGRLGLAQGIRLHPRVVHFLLGMQRPDAELAGVSRLFARRSDPPPVECDPEDVGAAVLALGAGRRTLVVSGLPRSGRELVLRHAAAELGTALLVVDGRRLTPDRAVAAFREALLFDAILAFSAAHEITDAEVVVRIADCLRLRDETLVLIASGAPPVELLALRPTSTVQVRLPTPERRQELWRRHLGEPGLDDAELAEIAGLYNLGVAGIAEAAASARDLAALARLPLRRAHVVEAVRQLFDTDLSSVAVRTAVTQTDDDLVLPPDLVESIEAIVDRIRLRGRVMGEWGFGRKVGKGLGLTVLFSGEPGTGKSMVAGLIARRLSLDLYVVDLSRVTSKWLGETEKNLARAFDAAEAGHVLLLFDEADTVLGKRTADVRSANDRNANLETNFILARLEQFQGVAIFTSNLASAIDPAVARRLAANVKFPFPDVDTRAELWRRMIPKETPTLEGDIDFDALAERYQLSGGYIRNVVVRAAFLAARHGEALEMAHIERAAEAEYRERGAITVGGRLG